MPDLQLKEHTFVVGDRHFTIANDAADSLLAWSLGNNHTWEPWQIKLYSKLVRSDSICIDIGGNIGTSALAMAHYAQSGHVYTFEPVKNTFEILSINIEKNGLKNITPSNIGISNDEGEATIRVNRSLLGNAHRISGPAEASDDLHYDETFRMRPLDAWMADNRVARADLIKVDVEGFELEVIEGGQKAFLGNEETVAIFEFGIHPQRQAHAPSEHESLRDIAFFRKLKSIYRHIFLIGRNSKLYPVNDYAHLRIMMLAGYPVDDLLCCQIVPAAVHDMIASAFVTAHNLPVLAFPSAKGFGAAVAYNRGHDGWSYPSPHCNGTRSGMIVSLSEPKTIRVELLPVSAQASDLSSHPTLLVAGDRDYMVDVLDRSVSLAFHLPAGLSYIFVETDKSISAASYFGNPGDQRNVGVRLTLPEFEAAA